MTVFPTLGIETKKHWLVGTEWSYAKEGSITTDDRFHSKKKREEAHIINLSERMPNDEN
jgi:hypothetical protein